MSRIGKQPIDIPEKVKIAISGTQVNVEGPQGKLHMTLHPLVNVVVEGKSAVVDRKDESTAAKSVHGLSRTLLSNMIVGVSTGFTKDLEINGVGYRAEMKGNELHMALGYSHPIVYPLPSGIKATVDAKKTTISLSSADKQLLGVTAAKIRSFRPPEPYLGKGVKYAGEKIRRKEGKSAGK